MPGRSGCSGLSSGNRARSTRSRWSPDGRRLAASLWDTDSGSPRLWLSVWDTTSGERVFRVEHVAELTSIAYSPDSTRLATGGKDGIVRVFDAADGRERAALFTGSMHVSGLTFSRDGRRLDAAGWGMGGIKAFDPDRDPRGRKIPGWPSQIGALTFDRDGLRVLGCDWNWRWPGLRRPGRWHRWHTSGCSL